MGAERRLICAAAVAGSLFALSGAAGAADGDPYLKTCYSSPNAAPCVQLDPAAQAADAELSPDGRHLYAAVWDVGGGYNGVRIFEVGSGGTIALRPGAAITTEQGPRDIDFSPDGRSAYVAAGNQLVVLARDPTSGALGFLQCFGPAPCTPVTAASSFEAVAVSPDSASVYARGANQLVIFDRNTGSGALSQKLGLAGCYAEESLLPCAVAAGVAGSGNELVVSPDGRNVYVSNHAPGGVAVFNRTSDGTLTQPTGTSGGCITTGGTSGAVGGAECLSASPTLAQASAVNVDAQGGFIIVSAARGNTVFRRDASTGLLSQTDCLDEVGAAGPPSGCHEVKGAAGTDAAFTPDGNDVVLNASGFGLSFFTFDRATGRLSQRPTRGCIAATPAPPCQHVAGILGGLGGVTVSPNGLYVFASFRVPASGGSIASFERDFLPRCTSPSITVRTRKPLAVPLRCTDANGDAITLAIATPPTFGTLGRVDQTNDRVRYTPDPKRKGRDTFKFRATAGGSAGPAATVTLNVVAAPAKSDRKPPNTRITAGPAKTTRSRTARFKFRSTERGSDFQCKPDWRKRWASCRSPKSYANLRRGRHSFRVRAIDRAGNVDRTPAKRVWVVR
jgi:DNA-binding beta-propeller fold protein YncE